MYDDISNVVLEHLRNPRWLLLTVILAVAIYTGNFWILGIISAGLAGLKVPVPADWA